MTDTQPTDALEAIQPGIAGEDARELGAALVRNGQLSAKDANVLLAKRNAAPLVENSVEIAQSERESLLASEGFREKYLSGDPEAVARLTALDLKIQGADQRKLLDHPTPPADRYHFDTARRYPNASTADVTDFNADATKWAMNLGLQPSEAADLVSEAHKADARPEGPEKDTWRIEQERLFTGVMKCAPDDARVQAASKTLSERSGYRVNLAGLVKSGGAELAIRLLMHAEYLQATAPKK